MCLAGNDWQQGRQGIQGEKVISEVLFDRCALAQLESYSLHFLLSWYLWWQETFYKYERNVGSSRTADMCRRSSGYISLRQVGTGASGFKPLAL